MFARRGCRVVAVDRTEPPAFAHEPWASQVRFLCADLENAAWPFGDDTFDAVVVTNYLFRPLMGRLIESLAPGGWLLYETFGEGNARFGRPSRADFLLRPGELLEVCRARLQVVAFEQGEATQPKPAVVQRIAARRAN
jgi:SAM-dependent methyltransferase